MPVLLSAAKNSCVASADSSLRLEGQGWDAYSSTPAAYPFWE